jgi:hypothetical protein
MKKIRVTSTNFSIEGWETEHIFMNTITKGLTFTQNSQYVTLTCPPGNPHNPGFHQGAVYLDLTTKDNTPTSVLRRLRLRNNKQTHRLDEISTLKYSTYIVANISNSAPVLVLQLETNPSLGLNQSDANIFFDPRYQTGLNPLGDRVAAQPAVVLNKWQEWDAAAGGWVLQNTPGTPGENLFTLSSYIKLHPDARIINTSIAIPQGGGGVRSLLAVHPTTTILKAMLMDLQ